MSQREPIPAIQLRAIFVTGPDAQAFLQSQLTIDLDAVSGSRLYPTAWCSPDGRVDTVMLLATRGDDVSLVMPEPMLPGTRRRIDMYRIGRDVEIGRPCPARPANGPTRGPTSGPANDGASSNTAVFELAFDAGRALVVDERADGDDPGSESGGESAGALPADWLRADIGQRMPWVLPATSKAFLPQMLGLEALGGLSYTKGCFPGQEVIARVHYRGRVKRRTVTFRLDAHRPPDPGTEFELAGKPATVLYAVAEPCADGLIAGLAVVAAEAAEGAAFTIGGAAGAVVGE